MFGPPPSRKSQQRNRIGQYDHSFTTIVAPLLAQQAKESAVNKEKEKEKILFDEPLSSKSRSAASTPATKTTSATNSSFESKSHKRTGDSASYFLNSNDKTFIHRSCAMKTFRVLAYRENPKTGSKILFDILDGRQYTCSAGMIRRVTNNAIVFDSKRSALSERFPSNQCGAAVSGNGKYPRILVAFDAWGHCRRRCGGGPSWQCEFVKIMQVLECLDPPHPVSKRLCDRYVDPFYFTKADVSSPPNRDRSGHAFRINHFFDAHHSN